MVKVYVKKIKSAWKGYHWHVLVKTGETNMLGNLVEESWTYYSTKSKADAEAKRLRKQIKKEGLPPQLRM